MKWLLAQYAELVAATRFLSILPLPARSSLFATQAQQVTPRLILGSAYFPLVGFVLALLLYLLAIVCNLVFPHLVVAALLTVALVLLTGGLHLDGLMDTCDGVFGGRTRERRLDIMRDSRLGGACALLLKFSLLASLAELNLHLLLIAFLTVLPCSRWAMVLALRVFPSARPGGLGATFRQMVTRRQLMIAGGMALLIATGAGHIAGTLVWLTTTGVALIAGAWFMDRLGGLTGDTYGAIAEISEVASLLVFLGMRSMA